MTKKKRIPEMIPVKKWLSLDEACSYMNIGHTKFNEISIKHRLTTSALGPTRYYKVVELDQIFEDSIIVKRV